MNFKDYLQMILGLSLEKPGQTPKIRRVKKKKSNDNQSDSTSEDKTSKLLNKVVISITWFMMALALTSLGAIIYFGVVGQEPPPILSDLLLGILGYLGGVLASYASFATSSD